LSSLDIEKQYQFDPEEYNNLIRKPKMIEDPAQYENLPPFQKPVRCPKCTEWVLRDLGVVNNKVVCPYESCEAVFCWICLTKARESDECCSDHFDNRNMLRCYGRQYEDVRNSTPKGVACKSMFKLLTLPF
jgi:hypothetical protein